MSHSLSELSFKIREIDDEELRQQMLRSIGEIMRQMDDGILDKVTKLHPSLSYEKEEKWNNEMSARCVLAKLPT